MRTAFPAPALVAAASLAASLVSPALAADKDDVASAFGNTVLSVYPDGRSQKVWMEPDGHWTGLSRRGDPLAGAWTVREDKICVRQSSPPTLPLAFCMPFPADPHVGSSWSARDLTGTPITLKIVRGKVAG